LTIEQSSITLSDMAAAPSPLQSLAEVILERPLVDYIHEKRTAVPRWSWNLIANQLSVDTEGKVNVSYEWLRQLYLAAEDERAETVA
jgi:hypothetical protein